MRLRFLFIFILVGICLSETHAARNEFFQDSVRRVTVKITATEKASTLDFDSLLNAKAAEMERNEAAGE
jgi:hypothetical protein